MSIDGDVIELSSEQLQAGGEEDPTKVTEKQ